VIGRSRAIRSVLAMAVTIGCARSAVDHETLGDRAYVQGSYAEALTEFRLALLQGQGSPARLRAKAGAAALWAGDLQGAVQEYGQLARADGQRLDEAADGIERVAREAIARGDRAALRAAVVLLRELENGRSVGEFATELASGGGGGLDLALLAVAAGNAPDARRQDSLMFAYAQALARAGRCEPAVRVFEALARRGRGGVGPEASAAAAACALRVAQGHLEAERNDPAEEWFRRAVTLGEGTVVGRAAYLGLGDVLRARGDLVGAAAAWDRVILGAAPGDSLAERARARLNAIGSAGTEFP
jgi:tetratricopeptide (TPR) repeat protein